MLRGRRELSPELVRCSSVRPYSRSVEVSAAKTTRRIIRAVTRPPVIPRALCVESGVIVSIGQYGEQSIFRATTVMTQVRVGRTGFLAQHCG